MNYKTIPASVPKEKISTYNKNRQILTRGSDNLFLIAADQKIEHLNDDFYGPGIAPEDASPEHIFNIARQSRGGILAAHLGLISQYGKDYPDLDYIVKINGKTNLGPNEKKNSAKPLWSVADVIRFQKQSQLKISAIGYTLYLGQKYEGEMLRQAAQAITTAHQAGLLAVLWIYPRGKGINEDKIHTIAGAAGVASSLGADFAKLKYPYQLKDRKLAAKNYREVILAAGKTKVICVGGGKQDARQLLSFVKLQLEAGASGLAIGRNLHQRKPEQAYRLAQAITALLHDKATLTQALSIYSGKTKLKQSKAKSKVLGLF